MPTCCWCARPVPPDEPIFELLVVRRERLETPGRVYAQGDYCRDCLDARGQDILDDALAATLAMGAIAHG